jgi:Aldehyde dehydrogenase family
MTTTPSSIGVPLRDPALFRQSCYVDGAWIGAKSGVTIAVDNPATGETLGTVPKCGAAETRDAIAAAKRAFPAWRDRTAKERAAVMRKWFELMLANQEDLARLMTTEQGKPLVESKGEVAYAAAFLEWFGEEAKRVYGDTIPGHQADKRIVVIKQAVGVAACITPWNFPLAMITRKAGPPPSPRDAPSCSSRHLRHRSRRWPSPSSANARVFRKACSTSSPARHPKSAASSRPVATSASCRSPDRPRSASS